MGFECGMVIGLMLGLQEDQGLRVMCSYLRRNDNSSNSGGEANLDIQWMMAMAPRIETVFWSIPENSTEEIDDILTVSFHILALISQSYIILENIVGIRDWKRHVAAACLVALVRYGGIASRCVPGSGIPGALRCRVPEVGPYGSLCHLR